MLFGTSGSEANDMQIKLSWYYNNARGKRNKKKIISRWKGYHGVTVASASLTDHDLLRKTRATGKPVILSTGMSTLEEIDAAVEVLGRDNLLIAHATSTYPCPPADLNLRMIPELEQRFPECPVGYSGHEVGLAPTWAAVSLGATFVERHITLDRALWGSDQAASVEIGGFLRLVSNIRDIEKSLGDGVKRVYDGERKQIEKLRRVKAPAVAPEPVLVA